jgi:hypothetical protein
MSILTWTSVASGSEALLNTFAVDKTVLGVFAKLRKATISFVISDRLSAWNNSDPTGWIFMKFDIWEFFQTRKEATVNCYR